MSSPGPSSASGKPDRLYVGNLAPTIDEHTLIQVFQKYGKITKLDFVFHKTGTMKGKPRGYAFIEYSSKDDALKAMVKLHDRLLRGRKLVVTYANAAPLNEMPLPSKGRRSEPARTTTLSLLKKQNKPHTAAAQIAAMEAKLASMQRTKPVDGDYIPGSSFGLTPPRQSGEEEENEIDLDEELGLIEGKKAAEELEKEMEQTFNTDNVPSRPSSPSIIDDEQAPQTTPIATSTTTPKPLSLPQGLKYALPPRPGLPTSADNHNQKSKPTTSLPSKPSFL